MIGTVPYCTVCTRRFLHKRKMVSQTDFFSFRYCRYLCVQNSLNRIRTRIRITWIRTQIRIKCFLLNLDPNPNPGFVFKNKICFVFFLQAPREGSSPTERASSSSIYLFFSCVNTHVLYRYPTYRYWSNIHSQLKGLFRLLRRVPKNRKKPLGR